MEDIYCIYIIAKIKSTLLDKQSFIIKVDILAVCDFYAAQIYFINQFTHT